MVRMLTSRITFGTDGCISLFVDLSSFSTGERYSGTIAQEAGAVLVI